MRLIDAGQIVYSWFVEEDGTISDGITLQSIINRLPTIDAVPVIRCKDCKYRQEDIIFHKLYCDGREVVADGFCWKGERRSDE